MTQRNRYVKVALFEPHSINLMGGTIVGQYGETLIVERPQSKPRAAAKATRKPRTAKAAASPASPATSFPGSAVANG